MNSPSDEGRPQDATRHAPPVPPSITDEALQTAIRSAQTAIEALKLVSDPAQKAIQTSQVKKLLAEAERIKLATRQSRVDQPSERPHTAPPGVEILQEPSNSREITRKEQIILLRAGFLNGTKFPEWKDPPSPSEFDLQSGQDLFFDEFSELPLSDYQFDVLDGWKRPNEALPPPKWGAGDRGDLGPSMTFYSDIDLVQDAATDCSVVASLCAGVARGQRGHQRILQSFMYPYDAENGRPQISKNGKYIIRMNFNGCYRKVVIDDRIPTSSTEKVIHVVDRNNPGLLWPALLEKAYLKVRGGYDFPGSNSATDLWMLTGWIPEQVFLQSDDLELDQLWERMSNAFSYGDVFITMGTGKMTSKSERALGLAGEHDYALLDLREMDGQRLMLVKNPWAEGQSWKGSFKRTPNTKEAGNSQSSDELVVRLEDDTEAVSSPRDLLNANDQLTPGTFWMDLHNVAQYFECIYLNWNPGLFAFRQDIHFEWDLTEPDDSPKARGLYASVRDRRQFTITSSKRETVWVLLWRHLQNHVPADATGEEIESGRHFVDPNGYICLRAFNANGRRIVLPDRYFETGVYVDSPQVLLKLEDCEPGNPYTIVPLEQELSPTKHSFTVSAFSRSPITISDAVETYAYSTWVNGTWNKDTAGGGASYASYCDNPQFSVSVQKNTRISLLLEACSGELVVHLKLVHSEGKRVFQVRSRDIIVDSKDYRRGCCFAECDDLDAGQYTVICSTFEPQQLGDFALHISSSEPVKAFRLPSEGAGRFRIELGAAAFKNGETKIAAPLVPRRLINFYGIARHLDARQQNKTPIRRSHYSRMRLSIELGRGPSRKILMASNAGEYSDGAAAIRTDPVNLTVDYRKYGDGECWIVLDRMYVSSEAQEERFSVELFVDAPQGAEVGEWRPWED